ncbi:MAG TPA: hypothetical protein VEV83_01125, partial [Parafilimonas sp.]|nr:hypothetical protein [Parafilimonas sp.]
LFRSENFFVSHLSAPEEPPVYKKPGNVSCGSIGASFIKVIDGKERPVQGSPGERILTSECG